MRILMLGNSFTSVNNMPQLLADLTGAEVVQHTRGGARLAEQLNPETVNGGLTQAALQNEKWDYVVLQEMSNGPITAKAAFLKNVGLLCERIRENGAKPLLYATWAYQRDGRELASFGMDYDEMYRQMYASYHEAADQNDALIADVGEKFYTLARSARPEGACITGCPDGYVLARSARSEDPGRTGDLEGDESADLQDLFADDGCHPNEAGSRLAAQTIAEVIRADQESKKEDSPEKPQTYETSIADKNDTRLRVLYLYRLLLTQTDEEHTLSTRQIMQKMQEEYGIYMHRTTVPTDISLLRAAGFEIIGERRQAWHYYLADRTFSVPELKILIDAVQSSRFITERKSQLLIDKLTSLTSRTNADKLKRTVHITGRVKSDNEKGYDIVDTINDAIHAGRKISFRYLDLDGRKRQVLRNNGEPYTVSPFDLIWDGDYYYLIGFCDERAAIRTFRVDRMAKQPELLEERAVDKPKKYDISRYTTEVFSMFAADEAVNVSLLCDNAVMKAIVDKFGMGIRTRSVDEEHFRVKVRVCTGPTFYRWVFGSAGKIVIEGPKAATEEYRAMLRKALEAQG